MAASRNVRLHEAAHAVAAHLLGIGLKEEGIILSSDEDAWVAIVDPPPHHTDEDWYIRRVAVKLAGPLEMCRRRGEKLEWDTLRYSGEYHEDFEEALGLFGEYWRNVGGVPANDQIDDQMNRAAQISMECVCKNNHVISAIADASDGRDQFSRTEIVSWIQRREPDGLSC